MTAEAADLFAQVGPTNRRPDPSAFADPPNEDRWQRDLAGQVRLTVTAAEASAVVRDGWTRLVATDFRVKTADHQVSQAPHCP